MVTMTVQGIAQLETTANGVRTKIEAIISPSIKELMLLSCEDLINLQIIPTSRYTNAG